MGGDIAGGADVDDADREPECEECRGKESPCAKCWPNTPSPAVIDPGVTGLPHLCPKCGASVPPAQTSQVCAVCTHSLVYPYSTKGNQVDGMEMFADEDEPTTVAEWVAQTRETGILEFEQLLAIGERDSSAVKDVRSFLVREFPRELELLSDVGSDNGDPILNAFNVMRLVNCRAANSLAIIAELCAAIETNPLGQTNEFVENARKRARDFLEANGRDDSVS
jgi:hypothetical protein